MRLFGDRPKFRKLIDDSFLTSFKKCVSTLIFYVKRKFPKSNSN